jgi:hypothetical protein
MHKVVDGPPGPKSDMQIFAELADRLGIDNYLEQTETERLEAIVAAEEDLPDRDELKRKGVPAASLRRLPGTDGGHPAAPLFHAVW